MPGRASYFDDKFEVMRRGHDNAVERALCYDRQCAILCDYLRPGHTLLDVGCGPSLPYRRPAGVRAIGMDPSFASIRANSDVDLRVMASASSIPMANASVNAVVCFYSIHHMVGRTKAETHQNVARAFTEFGRVLKPGGALFVFEMTPAWIFQTVQSAAWNLAQKAVPHWLDMYFWSAGALDDLGKTTLPKGANLERVEFQSPLTDLITPVFSLPWLKIPLALYPLDARLYKWDIPA
jgi:ubiquinone/menaquinone biosynthesis C-methylase UbiE